MINNNGLSGLFFIIIVIILILKKTAKSIIIATLLLSITTLLYHSSQKQISNNTTRIDKSNLYKFIIHRLDTILANFIIIHFFVFDKLTLNIQLTLAILCAYNDYYRFGILLFFLIIFYNRLNIVTIILIILSLLTHFSNDKNKWNCSQRIVWHLLTSLILLYNTDKFENV